MRLADLNPRWSRHHRDHEQTPDRGGFPTDEYELSFNCPACGPPYTINIRVGPEVRDIYPRCWKYSGAPMDAGWADRLSVLPSIDNTNSGHGRKHPTCGFHGHIINGDVINS